MPKSKAVLIGIADYSPVGEGGPDLAGCINDVENMANTLHILGWPKSTIKIATNKRATTRRIRNLLEWLVKGARPGDRLFLHFSGHGSQVPDIDLDGSAEPEAETDQLDEILCPADLDWEGNYISDDEFAAAFKTLPDGVNLDVFFDCCFSGSATRSLTYNPTVAAFSSASRDSKIKVPRYLAPPVDFDFHIRNAKMVRNPAVTVTKNSNHTLWSACQEYQTSVEYEMEGKVQGSATYELCKILRACEGNITRGELYAIWADAHARKGDEQVPRIDSNDRMLALKPFSKTHGASKVVQAENAEYRRLQAARKGKSGIFGGALADVKIAHNTITPYYSVSTQPLETARTEENMMLSLGHNIVSTVKPKQKRKKKRGRNMRDKLIRPRFPRVRKKRRG